MALPVTIPYYDDELGATVIRYATSPPEKTDSGKTSWSTKYIEFRGNIVITDKQKDLAWFLLFASNLVEKGVYQLVDIQAKYEGTFNDIVTKKNVLDFITGKNEDVIRNVAIKFISESYSRFELQELASRVNEWLEETKQWSAVWDFIRKSTSEKILQGESISALEWEGEEVFMMKCPPDVKHADLKGEAQSLGIKITAPPQTKDVLYSLIQHIRELE